MLILTHSASATSRIQSVSGTNDAMKQPVDEPALKLRADSFAE
jgi:hypothetical protein